MGNYLTPYENLEIVRYSLYLFGIFVADKNHNWVNVDAVEPFNSMWGDVEQTVAALHPNTQNTTSLRWNKTTLVTLTYYSGFTYGLCFLVN